MITFNEKFRQDIGWDELLMQVSQRCATRAGSDEALRIVPCVDMAAAQQRSAALTEMRQLLLLHGPLPFGGMEDIRALFTQTHHSALEPLDLRRCQQTLQAQDRLRTHLLIHADGFPETEKITSQLRSFYVWCQQVEQSIDAAGELKETASITYRSICTQLQQLQGSLAAKAERWLRDASLSHLWQDRYVVQRGGRFALPIRGEFRAAIRGIVIDVSASKATAFVEPEAWIEDNNQLRMLQSEKEAEALRIVRALTDALYAQRATIERNIALCATLDALQAQATLSRELMATPVTWATDKPPHFLLHNARHPLLLLRQIAVVPNDFSLETGQTLVISGPNAGGKTALMKLVGLLTCMAQAGMDVPAAEGATLPWFDHVLSDIGDEQSLQKNVSTFSAHLLSMQHFLSTASPHTLFLIDEIATGTDPHQGAALAQALLEAFLQRGATVLVTTHYPALKYRAMEGAGFRSASVGFELETLRPTFRVHFDAPGPSETLPVAKQWGLPQDIIDRAHVLAAGSGYQTEQLLQNLLVRSELLSSKIQELDAQQARLAADQAAVEALRNDLATERQALRKQALDQTVRALQEAQRALKEWKQAIQNASSADEISTLQQKINEKRSEIQSLSALETENQKSNQLQDIKPGKAFIPSLGIWADVIEGPADGKIELLAGRTRLRLDVQQVVWKDQAKTVQSPKPSAKAVVSLAPHAISSSRPVRTAGQTLDLRGSRADEALARAEAFVSKALQLHWDAVFLIHGHGTGKLREALRAFFTGHPTIRSVEPGLPDEGGDGLTVILL